MVHLTKRYYKSLLLLIIGFFYLNQVFFYKKWEDNTIINHDVIFYYSYLPAIFIYQDPTFHFTDTLPPDFEGRIWYLTSEKGMRYPKMSIGTAVLYSPFFLMAHLYAKINRIPANGYTWPYSFFICMAAVFYALLGFWLIMKLLENYFSPLIIFTTIIGLAFGTNLYYYTTYESGMSHTYSFFLFALFTLLTYKWHKKNYQYAYTFWLAFILGLIIITRPTNGIIVLLPILYNITNRQQLFEKIKTITTNTKQLLLVITGLFLPLSLQLIFWKLGTGTWIVYSYQNEGFYFLHPHIIDGLFSFRKGWLLYTPIMTFAIIGIWHLKKYASGWKINIPIWIVLHIYIIYSWWCWWYGGSFGSRPMIETYAVLSMPLAALIKQVNTTKTPLKIGFSLLFISFIALNIFQTKQYRTTLIHWDSMTKDAYWSIFLKEHFPKNYDQLIQPPNYEKALKGDNEY